jgi:crossover junction endodeoxyribonuclease RusA
MAKKKEETKDLPRLKAQSKSKTLSLNLPLPPSINHLHYNTRNGGKRPTEKALNFIRESRALINLEVDNQKWSKQYKGVWLYIDLVFYFPDRRRRDASNCLKILLDVMQGIIYDDDMYALPRIQSVEYDVEKPRVEVRISTQSTSDRDKALNLATLIEQTMLRHSS